MTTEAQVSANRSNARKSTGPRTPEGKAIVAQNAVTHGFFAQEVVLQATRPGPTAPGSEEEAWAADRKIVQDFAETRILDRLLVHERRIEHSLYRTMAERRSLRRSHAQGAVPAGTAAVGSVPVRAHLPSRKETPDGVTANLPEAQGASCETKPIGPDRKEEDAGRGRPTLDQVRGGLHEKTPAGVGTNVSEVQGQSCETKPICILPCGIGVLPVDVNLGRICETKPISAGMNQGQAGYRPVFRRRR